MQSIVPCIWFDHTAQQAAEFYTSVFPSGRIIDIQRYPTEGLPDFQAEMAGQPLVVQFELAGYEFTGINAGPEFQVNPSISFLLNFDPSVDPDAKQHLDRLWAALSDGGTALMPLASYPFSPHYGWIADRYGVSWQLMLTDPAGDRRPFITPSLLFGQTNQGRAAEAIDRYTSLFNGAVGTMVHQPDTAGPVAGEVMFADFQLAGQWFSAMDSAGHDFTFNPGVSFMVRCADQGEIDRLWDALSAVPAAEQCGWLVDRYGVSWQIVPAALGDLMAKPGAYPKLMQMKKIDIAAFG
ncbi:MAG: hypothetical protein BGO26_20245 [Actinobacteria bacterium 69-20]|nr:VOC family protein [Actinomycetota bacterium]OJV24835.1 MAG: hypothetical protein BGO26_20245 [Actinobacteria bacterium 69-20]